MDQFKPFPIYDMKYGKVTARKPWLLPYDAFSDMLNVYAERGVLKKRKGFTEFGRLSHFVNDEDIGTGNSSDKTFADTLTNTPVRAGSVVVTDGTEAFADNGDGTLTGAAGGVGTIVYATGAISVTFHTAPGAVHIHCDYSYYRGLPVMGIFEHFTASGRYLMAFDTKRMHRWNTSSSVFEDKATADTWTGADDDFFHVCSATDDKLYITNGVDQIRTWDGATLAAFTIDYDADAGNEVNTCKFIFEYWGHLVILAPTEDSTYRGRRYRCSAAGTYTSWPSYCWADAPTPDEIMGAKMIGNVLYVWFKESLWRLNYTGIYTMPFQWERVSAEEGLYAGFSTAALPGNKAIGIGKNSIVGTDTTQTYDIDNDIPNEILSYASDKIGYAYAGRIRELRHVWWSLCDVADTYPKRILAYNYEDENFFPFELSFHCFGSFTAGSTITLDDVSAAWDDIDYTWDNGSTVSGYPIDLGGTHDGYVMQLNEGYNDNTAVISFEIKSGDWNPYHKDGREARLGWIDFLVSVNSDSSFSVDFYSDQDPSAYLTDTVACSDDDTRGREMVWKRVDCGCTASSHRIKISHNQADQPVEIHAIVPHFAPGGRLV